MSSSEKQMFIKAILDLKQEVDRLNAAVFKGEGSFARIAPPAAETPVETHSRPPQEEEEAEWQETDYGEPLMGGSLSLQKAEEENIRRSLEKHHGNRKLAAAELGISERTLYRRLSKK